MRPKPATRIYAPETLGVLCYRGNKAMLRFQVFNPRLVTTCLVNCQVEGSFFLAFRSIVYLLYSAIVILSVLIIIITLSIKYSE